MHAVKIINNNKKLHNSNINNNEYNKDKKLHCTENYNKII